MDNKVKGFHASAAAAGLKKNGGLDLAVIFSEVEAAAAGVFTNNAVKAAPVLLTREHVGKGRARAIIVNSGNANACTGSQGLSDARRTAALIAEQLHIASDEVLVASTGVIGQPLRMDLISHALPDLVAGLSPEGIPMAVSAMMTTDSFPKMSLFEGDAGGIPYRILGVAKGAGMIMPNMATMLCFVLSDIRIGPEELQRVLLASTDKTFNRITVDGDTSTNDMVLVMANGMAGNPDLNPADLERFQGGLLQVMGDLARMIVRDGEGATKLVQVEIIGAESPEDAGKAARTVANSSLVKTAFFGQDPNWGRIMAALGRSGITMSEDSVDIWIDDVQIVGAGMGKGMDAEKKAAEIMTRKEFLVKIDLNQGSYTEQMITCDLTHDYVSINADYRS
jgi:glutamate N-acetyltransferase / amino-acid N-acetyltransferase